jgi:hypothetical protein
MAEATLTLVRWLRVGAPVHAVALAGDGRHLLAGSEHDLRLLDLWGNVRFRYFEPAAPGTAVERDLPCRVVCLRPDTLAVALAGFRAGALYRLDLTWHDENVEVWPDLIRNEANDIHDLSYAPGNDLVAIGHLGPALTVIDLDGQQRWRRHPDDHNATDGKGWVVALSPDGQQLYAGSSGSARHRLVILNAASGSLLAGAILPAPITLVAGLPAPLTVAAVLNFPEESQLVVYGTDLRKPAWSYVPETDGRVTALAADQAADLVVIGTNAGSVVVLDATSGRELVRDDSLHSTVLSLAIAGGRYIAVGLQDGQVAYLEYAPPEEEVQL